MANSAIHDEREKPRYAALRVSLPDPMKAWVDAQAKGGKYGNASDDIRDLIRCFELLRERPYADQPGTFPRPA